MILFIEVYTIHINIHNKLNLNYLDRIAKLFSHSSHSHGPRGSADVTPCVNH